MYQCLKYIHKSIDNLASTFAFHQHPLKYQTLINTCLVPAKFVKREVTLCLHAFVEKLFENFQKTMQCGCVI